MCELLEGTLCLVPCHPSYGTVVVHRMWLSNIINWHETFDFVTEHLVISSILWFDPCFSFPVICWDDKMSSLTGDGDLLSCSLKDTHLYQKRIKKGGWFVCILCMKGMHKCVLHLWPLPLEIVWWHKTFNSFPKDILCMLHVMRWKLVSSVIVR